MKRSTLWMYGCIALWISACGPHSPSSGGDGTSTPVTGPVSGKLVDGAGNPLTYTPVLLLGAGEPVLQNTDGAGQFSFSQDVAATYDIATVTARDTQDAVVYKGLTRRSITLTIDNGLSGYHDPGTSHRATLNGTLSGGQTPYVDKSVPQLFFTSATQDNTDLERISAKDSWPDYARSLTWYGPATSVTGSLFALQSTLDAAGLPTAYPGYGRRDNITLGDKATVSAQDIHMEAVANGTLAFNLAIPTGLQQNTSTEVYMVLPDKTSLALFYQLNVPGSSVSYVVPQVPQATFSVTVETGHDGFISYASATGLTAGSTTSLSLPDVPAPKTPADKVEDVTQNTDFSWSPVPGGFYVMQIGSRSDKLYKLTLFTTDVHTPLPDLSKLGLVLPTKNPFRWSVLFFPSSASGTTLDPVLDAGKGLVGFKQQPYSTVPTRSFLTAATP